MTDIQPHLERLALQPADPAALSAVEAAYSGQGRWEELLRVYEDNALRAAESEAAPLLRKAAMICLNELASSPRAEVYLRRALEVAPLDGEASQALRDIYMARGEYERALELYERDLARSGDGKERARGLVEVADIYRERLGKLDKALGALRQAERIDKSNPDIYRQSALVFGLQGRLEQAHDALQKELALRGPNDDLLTRIGELGQRLLERAKLHHLATAAADSVLTHRTDDQRALSVSRELSDYRSNWSTKVVELAQRATQLEGSNRSQAADAWLTVAEVQLVYGEQTETALASLDRALAAQPGHPLALKLLEEVYGRADRFDELSLKLEMMAAYTREPHVAVELYLKAAMHHAVRLDNPEAAARIYQRVLQLEPGNKVASNALAEFYRERQQWNEALAVLSSWAERATQGGDKVAAHYACCRILEEELGERTAARPHYEAILGLDPENQAAARALEDVYREAQDHSALARVLRAKLAGLSGEERHGVLAELGELYAGPLTDAALALDVLGELYRDKPEAALREQLEELAARAGAFAALVRILEGGLDRIANDADKVQALHSLAALYEGAREAPLEALRMHRRILAIDSNDERARQAVLRLLETAAASGDKVAFYQEQAQAASSESERAGILHRLARELVDNLKDYVRATDVYRQILKIDAGDADAIDGLLALYRRDNRWAEVAEVLGHKLERLPAGPLQVPLLLELGAIFEQKLDQAEGALDCFCRVLDAAADNADAISALERLLSRTSRVQEIAARLEPRYRAQGRWDMVAQMMEIRVSQCGEPQDRAAILVQLAELYEKQLQQPPAALAALLRAFQADPSHTGLVDQLERMGAAASDLRSVVRAYRSAGRVLEGEERLAIIMRAGALADKDGDVAGALVDYLRLVGVAEPTGAAALAGLERLAKVGVDATRLREASEQVADSLDEPQLSQFWRKLAVFNERVMNSPADAIVAWKSVLSSHQNDPEAQAELDRLFQTAADPAELVQHLRDKIEQAADDVERAALGGQLAEVLADKAGDLQGAIAELVKVSELTPAQKLVWQRMSDLYLRAEMPNEAAQALHREINLLSEGPERRQRLVAFADISARQLGDVSVAVSALQGVLAQEPAQPQAMALLVDLYPAATDPSLRQSLAQLLLAGYKAAGNWQEAAVLLAGSVDTLPSVEERVSALREVAAIKADKLGDAAGAYAELERAFHDAPLDADLRAQLESAAEKAGALERVVEAYAAALGVIVDAEAQRPLRRRLAQTLEKLGRGAEAVEHYRAAGGGTLPDDLPSLESMERLLREQNRPQELCDVLEAMAHKLPADAKDKKKQLLMEIGQLCESQVSDKQRALDAYRGILAVDDRDVAALRQLEQLLSEMGQHAELANVLDRIIELSATSPDIVVYYLKRARVALELGDADEAFKAYRAVLLKKREHPDAIAGLETLIEQSDNKLEVAQVLEPLYTAKQDHAKLAWVLERRLDGTEDLTQRKGLLRRIGDIYENRLQQKDRAFAMARRSLSEDPADMGVRMWIEKLAGETGALAALAAAYVEEAGKAEAKLALQFHRRAAAILHEKLNDVAGAVAEYQAILALEERDEKALTGLEALFRASESYADLVGVLQRRLGMTAGLERKREYLNEIASLQSEKLGDLTGAVTTYRSILEVTPEDPAAFAAVEGLLAQLSQWEELVAFYEAEIARLADKRGKEGVMRRHEMMYRRGRILDEQFGDREQARATFAEVLGENPEHPSTLTYLQERAQAGVLEAMTLLEEVYRGRGAWKQYVDLLEAKLSQTAESNLRRGIYLEIADTYDQHLMVGDMAFLALTRAYNENRADYELLEKLEETAKKHGSWEELVEVLGQDLDAVADPKLRQHLLHRLGDICGNQLNNPQQAVAYLQQALQYDPRDEQALATVDGLLEKHQMWAALAEVLERRIEVAAEPSTKSQLLERLASVWGDKLMDAEAALRCHKQILEIDPDHPLTLKSMQKLYAEVQDWDSLAKNLARQAEVLTEAEDQVRIHSAAGELYAEEFGDNAAAIEHWAKVVDLVPSHPEANSALEVLLTAEDRWEELADLYQRQLAITKDLGQKSEINRRLGVILGEKLGRSEDALSSWLEVLQHDARNLDALWALLGLYSERAMWEEFVGIARRLIPLVDPGEAKEVRIQLAKALGENLGRREDAIKLGREVRASEPHVAADLVRLGEVLVNIEAFDEAVVTIEKAAALEEDVDVKVGRYYEAAALYRDRLEKPNDAREAYEAILEARPEDGEAFSALAEIYRNTQEWRKLVALNESFVPHAEPDARLAILTEIRDVQDGKLGEKELAFIAACRVYKENPSSMDAAEVLERIGLETDGAEELVAVLEDEIDNIVDTDAKIETLRRIARVYAQHLSDAASAEGCLNRILEIAPADLAALDELSSLGAREERYDKQIQALETKLTHVAEDVERKSVLFEIARIWEDKIGEVDEAIAALGRLLEIDGSDIVALDALARIYEQESRWSELAHTLTRKVELTQDPAESVTLRMRVGALCEGDLNDDEAAIQWYRGVLDFEAAHVGALASLERLYTGLERWSELVQVFEVQLANAQEVEEQIRLLSKMASIYENEFDSLKDAANCFERVLQIDSTHIASIKNLERLLRALSEWNRLIEILQHHITLLTDENEITDLYLEIGEIYYRELSRVDKAEQIYNSARQLNPKSAAALHALGQLYERSGNWFQSLEMLQQEADALGADTAALPILLRIGRINEEMLMDMGAAKTAYERALTIDPTYAPALAAMKEIAKSSEDWEAYAEHLITEAETSDDLEEKTELFVEAAKFFQDVRGDEASALRYYERALEVSPESFEVARSLGEIHFRNENWEEAGRLYEIVLVQLDKAKDAKDYCQKSHRLGYISEKLGERERALDYYRQAFEADATYLPALEGLGQALLANEQWEEAQKVFQSILIHHRDSLTESEVVDVQWQLGDICLKQGQPDRAYKQFERALEIDPDHAPALTALADLDKKMENWEGAYERLSRLAEVAPTNERGRVLLDMSDIAEQRLSDPVRSIEALERARRMGQPPVEVLQRLAELYVASHQGAKAAEVLELAVTLAGESGELLSELNYCLGVTYETEVKHEPLAVQKYNAALDAAATNVKAFEAIERLLTARQEWALLEANYRAMIARAKELSPQIRLVLWRNLAELYRRVLGNVDGAIMAYEVIQKLDPGKKEDSAALAELYAYKPEHRKKAITMQHEVVPTLDNPVAPIRALRKLYHSERDFDSVFVLCSVLAFLNEADDEERKILEYLAQGVPQKATRGLLEDSWKLLLHRNLLGPVGLLASWLYRSAADIVTVPAKDLGLKKKDHIDPRTSDLYFANLARYAGKVLNVQAFDIYRKAGSMEPLHLVNAQPPALVAGENNEVFRDSAQRVVLFTIGRNLAYARPEMFLAGIYPPDTLRDMLFGLCVVYNRALQHNGDPREVERWAAAFERLPPPTLKRLQAPTQAAYPELLRGGPLEAYAAAVELTAARAGLLVAGDLASAVRGISEGTAGASGLPVRERIKELVLFAASRPHFELRKLIGAALVENKAAAAAK